MPCDITDKDLTLQRLYTISGTINKTDGNNALSGATVRLLEDNGITEVQPSVTATMDANGKYTLRKVFPGTYTIEASKTDYQSARISSVTVTDSGSNITGQDLTLQRIYKISGTIKQDDGNDALNGAQVKLKNTGGTVVDSTSTGTDGKYTFSGVFPGVSYTIEVSLPNYKPYTFPSFDVDDTGTDITDKDWTLQRYCSISGTITKSDIGAANASAATVRLLKTHGTTEVQTPVTAEPDGKYTFSNVISGSYIIEASLTGYVTDTLPISVSGDMSGQDLALDPAAYSISGTITKNGGGGGTIQGQRI